MKVTISSEDDILKARFAVRQFITENGLHCNALNRMHILTAVSELCRNIYKYAKKGEMIAEIIESNGKKGIKLLFVDEGPGIPNLEDAMKPKPIGKWTDGMGLGLAGSKCLSDEFDIKTAPGMGTRITFIKWI